MSTRGRPIKNPSEKLSEAVRVLVTPGEKEWLVETARRSGYTLSQWARRKLTGEQPERSGHQMDLTQ